MDRASGRGRRGDRKQLLDVVRRVRNRWRLRTLLRGLAVLVGAGLVAFIVTAYGLELARFSPAAVVAFRILTYLTVAVLAYVYVVRPLAHRVTDEQVALYLEEHEPSLESAVLTAVEKAKDPDDPLVVRLVTDALDRTRDVEYGQRVDRTLLYRYAGILAGVGVVGVFLFLLGPSTLRNGATALLFPNRQAEELTPFSIQVEPGDVTVAQGSDQLVSARLVGFESGEVELVTLDGDGNVVDAAPMFSDEGLDGSSVEGAEEPGGFQRMMLNVEEPVRYFVRSSGVRSSTFTIDVAEIPYVDRLEMVYHFPAYTGLEPRTVDNGGHIAVLPGTRVELRATSSVATDRGRLVLDDSSQVALTPDEEGFLAGEMTVNREGGYVVELERPDGRMGAASPHYSIDLLSDQPPLVEFEKPGRDSQASAIEEVFLQVRGEDDYGVRTLDLVYSVNGAPEDTVRLVGDGGPPTTDVSAGHTFFLEEWDLVPGDVISYYAVARDNNGVTGSQEVVSDIYFLSVRRLSQEFTAAEQRGGGEGELAGEPASPRIREPSSRSRSRSWPPPSIWSGTGRATSLPSGARTSPTSPSPSSGSGTTSPCSWTGSAPG